MWKHIVCSEIRLVVLLKGMTHEGLILEIGVTLNFYLISPDWSLAIVSIQIRQ